MRTTLSSIRWVFTGLSLSISSCHHQPPPASSNIYKLYQYKETRELVNYIEEASTHLKTEGIKAFEQYLPAHPEACSPRMYLFAYDLNGTCLFHPMIPEIVGKDLSDMKDLSGKPVIQEITRIAGADGPGSGWVHYLWAEGEEISPRWKSSYITRVILPEGDTIALGSGIYGLKTEKTFITDIVNTASSMLEKKGFKAIPVLQSDSGFFVYQDTYVFVMDEQGFAIADPSFPGIPGRNLIQMKDALGRPLVDMVKTRLAEQDSAWITYMWIKANESHPSRKLAYIKRIRIDGVTYLVGSSYFMEKPIWMKH